MECKVIYIQWVSSTQSTCVLLLMLTNPIDSADLEDLKHMNPDLAKTGRS